MGTVFDAIDPTLAEWVEAQPLPFVSTAPLAENAVGIDGLPGL